MALNSHCTQVVSWKQIIIEGVPLGGVGPGALSINFPARARGTGFSTGPGHSQKDRTTYTSKPSPII